MKALFSFLVCWCWSISLWAHQISIKGVVYDQATNAPLAGATVALRNTDKVAVTNTFGVYVFTDLAAGQYELVISYLGYQQGTVAVAVQDAVTARPITKLETGSLQLNEVAVGANQDKSLTMVISAVDMQLRPVQNAQEILRLIPGLFIAQHAGGGKAEQLFLRGFDIDHGTDISLTADGMPVNMVSHAHGQGYADLHFLIPETVQSVDYGKGPYEATKGNFATAGYADFRTRSTIDRNLVKLEAGRFNTYRTMGQFNLLGQAARAKQQHAYLATEYLFSNGYFESPQNFNRANVFGRYQGVFRNNTIVNGSLSAFSSRWNASGQIPERAVREGLISRFGTIDNTEGGHTARYNANINVERVLGNAAILKSQLYYSRYDFKLYSNFTFFLNDPVNGDQIRQSESRDIYGYRGAYETVTSLLGKPLRSEAGLGFRYDRTTGSELARTRFRNYLSSVKSGDVHELNPYTYLNETWEVSPRLAVTAALRFDQLFFSYRDRLKAGSMNNVMRANRGRLSPKLTINYNLASNVQLYFKTGLGFHSNDARVSVLPDHREILPVARGMDLGVALKPTDRLIVNAALWALDLQQEFVYVGDEGVVEPSGKTRRYGIDVSVRYQLTDYLFAHTDINLAKPRSREGATAAVYIPLAPTATSTGGITYNRYKKVQSSFTYRYLGHRAANEDYSLTATGYLLLDAVVSYTRKNLEFKISAENLLNSNWKEAQFATETRLRSETAPVTDIHFTPGTPFFMRAGISYSF